MTPPTRSVAIRRPAALLFDLDGTLVDSRRDIADACNAALAAHGLAELDFEAILPMIGDGARALVARAVLAAAPPGAATDARIDAVLATLMVRYLERPCVHTVLLAGAREILDDARRASLPCAVVTNKPHDVTVGVLGALGLGDAFVAIWGGGDGPLKPAPDGVNAMIARIGARARDVWMIGDGPQDIGAGKAAGCTTIGVPGIAERARLVASAPDVLCESLGDVGELLRSLTADRA